MGNANSMKWVTQFFKDADRLDSHDWRLSNYLALDLETTGLDLLNDEIISIGSVEIYNGRIVGTSKVYSEIKPKQKPSVAAMQVHGLRDVDLAEAKTIKEVAPELRSRLGGKILVAHAAWIESAFLRPHLKGAFPAKIIDTAALARACGYGQDLSGHEPDLEYLARQLNLPVYSPHHALGDAMTTAVVFLALATELEKRHKSENGDRLSSESLIKISDGFRIRS